MKHLLPLAVCVTLLHAATDPVCAEGRSESWLAQIEASLAATAAHLKVESAERDARVNTAIHSFRSESTPKPSETPTRIALPSNIYRGGSAAREARIQHFKLSEQVRMQREALINRGLDR